MIAKSRLIGKNRIASDTPRSQAPTTSRARAKRPLALHLPAKRTLDQRGIARRTFSAGLKAAWALADRPSEPSR